MEGTSVAPLLQALGRALADRELSIAAAESCTGGLLAAALIDLPEASFEGGVVAYSAEAKRRLLDVPAEAIERHGAISPTVAELMAAGARARYGVDVAISITGVAGPSGEEGKPVGLVYIGASLNDTTVSREHHFQGGRAAVRVASVEAAINLATELLTAETPQGEPAVRISS
jgi:PncC family amidohydrolase